MASYGFFCGVILAGKRITGGAFALVRGESQFILKVEMFGTYFANTPQL